MSSSTADSLRGRGDPIQSYLTCASSSRHAECIRRCGGQEREHPNSLLDCVVAGMPEIGQLFDGKYQIVRQLGSGGMGAVYEAENVRIGRRVALKVLHAEIAADATAVARFQQEAAVASRIGSPHIVEVLDAGRTSDGVSYMVLELLTGEPLSARIARAGSLTPERALPLATQVLDGLSAAHAVGVVHRDLKPENIWVCDKGPHPDFVKLLDFGVCMVGGGLENLRMTCTGMAIGTPMYMAPEQARGEKQIDARVDVYAAGVLLYELLTGRAPFSGSSVNEVLFDVVLKEPPDPRTYVPALDRSLVLIVQRAMAKRREDRWPSADALRSTLVAWREGAPLEAVSLPGSSSRRSWREDGAGAAARVPPRGPATVPVLALAAPQVLADAPTALAQLGGLGGPRPSTVEAPPATALSPGQTPALEPERASPTAAARPRFAGYTAPARGRGWVVALTAALALVTAAVGATITITRAPEPPPTDEDAPSATAATSGDTPPMPCATSIVTAAPKPPQAKSATPRSAHGAAPSASPRPRPPPASTHGPRIRETMD